MIIATPHDGEVVMSPTGLRACHQLAGHTLATHWAYPEIHSATLARLQGQGLVTGDHGRHALRLTALGWAVIGAAVTQGLVGK